VQSHTHPYPSVASAANDLLAIIPLLPTARTDCGAVELPEPKPLAETMVTSTLDAFEASLLELAGAVKTQLERPVSTEAAVTPPFDPDDRLSAAARVQRMTPPAGQAIDELIGQFQSTLSNDPADVEPDRS